jgi:hypothetical protein
MDENLTLDRVGVHTLDYVFSDSWVFFFRFVCGWWLEFNLFRFRRRRIFGSLRERDQKAKKKSDLCGFSGKLWRERAREGQKRRADLCGFSGKLWRLERESERGSKKKRNYKIDFFF